MGVNLYVYFEEDFGHGLNFNMVAPHYLSLNLKDDDVEIALTDAVKEAFSEEMIHIVESSCKDIDRVTKMEFVTAKHDRWVGGDYYAHEYDKYVDGRRREITYSNGYVEYEVECLDKDLRVLDGMWEEPDNNGCGDYFRRSY